MKSEVEAHCDLHCGVSGIRITRKHDDEDFVAMGGEALSPVQGIRGSRLTWKKDRP